MFVNQLFNSGHGFQFAKCNSLPEGHVFFVYGGFHKWGTLKWIETLLGKSIQKWMMTGGFALFFSETPSHPDLKNGCSM